MQLKLLMSLLIVFIVLVSGCSQSPSNPQNSNQPSVASTGNPWSDQGYKESSLVKDIKTSAGCDFDYTNRVELTFSKESSSVTLKVLPKVYEVSNWAKDILEKESANPCYNAPGTCSKWNREQTKCETFTENAPSGGGVASIKAVCSFNFKCQAEESGRPLSSPQQNSTIKYQLCANTFKYCPYLSEDPNCASNLGPIIFEVRLSDIGEDWWTRWTELSYKSSFSQKFTIPIDPSGSFRWPKESANRNINFICPPYPGESACKAVGGTLYNGALEANRETSKTTATVYFNQAPEINPEGLDPPTLKTLSFSVPFDLVNTKLLRKNFVLPDLNYVVKVPSSEASTCENTPELWSEPKTVVITDSTTP